MDISYIIHHSNKTLIYGLEFKTSGFQLILQLGSPGEGNKIPNKNQHWKCDREIHQYCFNWDMFVSGTKGC